MPALDNEGTQRLLGRPTFGCACGIAKLDYCRTCDEFYWVHRPGCRSRFSGIDDKQHYGHRLTIVPFVEVRRVDVAGLLAEPNGRKRLLEAFERGIKSIPPDGARVVS